VVLEEGDGQPADVLLDLAAEVGDRVLRRDPQEQVRANEVAAWTRVAAPAASPIHSSRSARRLPMTSSISSLVLAGSTIAESRLTRSSASPAASRPSRAHTSFRASRQTTLSPVPLKSPHTGS